MTQLKTLNPRRAKIPSLELGGNMQRREFITLLGGAAVARSFAAQAQQPGLPVVGFLVAGSPESDAFRLASVRKGLIKAGYVEGRNIAFEYRWALDHNDRLPALAVDLVRREVAVIVAIGGTAPALERDGSNLNRLRFPNQKTSDSTCRLGRRPAWMGRPYSDDLRERVVRAVIRSGLSRHQAAAQFGVGISTAINWVRRFHETGSIKPDQIGGYRPKKIAGPHREWLMQRCRKDFTLRGLVAELAERGLKVDYRTMWEFVHAEKLSFKKRR